MTVSHRRAPLAKDSVQYVPEMLKRQKIWCCFKTELRPDGRIGKIPCTPQNMSIRGEIGSTLHSSKLVSYEEADAAYRRDPATFAGIGFFTDKRLGIILADFDTCYEESGRLKPYVEIALDVLNSYTEESFSDNGKHCLFRGKLPGQQKVFKEDGIELYDTHFVVWTGRHDEHYPTDIQPRQEKLNALYTDLLNHQEWRKNKPPPQETVGKNLPALPPVQLSDSEVIGKAQAAKGGRGADFARLHNDGDITSFTHPHGRTDPSKADYRYFSLLAFWCGRDSVQMERIARTSALYRPERWDTGNYLSRTIQAANQRCSTVYTGTVKMSTGGGGGAEFETLFQRMMSHKELSVNRRSALLALVTEYHRNRQSMDEDGFVPICYRSMSTWCFISEQSLGDAGSAAEQYGLLEKRSKQGNDFKTELRMKLSPAFATGDFPPLKKTKKPGGKRIACSTCATEEVDITKKTMTSILCRNPECEYYGVEREIFTIKQTKRQKASGTTTEEPEQHYHCTIPSTEEEDTPSVGQVDVPADGSSVQEERHSGTELPETQSEPFPVSQVDRPTKGSFSHGEPEEQEWASKSEDSHHPPTCDTHVGQFDVSDEDEVSSQEEEQEDEELSETLPEPFPVSQVDVPTKSSLSRRELKTQEELLELPLEQVPSNPTEPRQQQKANVLAEQILHQAQTVYWWQKQETLADKIPEDFFMVELPCERCGCALYRQMAEYQVCVRCYPPRGYHLYKHLINAAYPRKR